MAALLAGQSVTHVAEQYNIPKSVVSGWKNTLGGAEFEQVRTEKGARIEALLFDYLGANLTALKAQANVATDEAYLKRFPPQQLAVLHGVMADKSVRLLEALTGVTGPEVEGEPAAEAV